MVSISEILWASQIERVNTRLCTLKYILWLLGKSRTCCDEHDVVQLGRVGNAVGIVHKDFLKEVTFKLRLEEYIGISQENDIPGKGNYFYKGFHAGRDLTNYKNGKEACVVGKIERTGWYMTV